MASHTSHNTYLGNGLCLAQTQWGGHVVVPTYNIDVAIGLIRDGIHEPWTTRLVSEFLKSGDCYVNVGANFGYYTSLGGRIVGSTGKVFSYEANPEVFSYLMKTIFYSGIPDITEAYNRAAYHTSGLSLDFLYDYQYIGGGHLRHDLEKSIKPTDNPFWSSDSIPELLDEHGKWISSRGLYNECMTKTITLDETIIDMEVDLIQCDVEGAEPYVFMGAQNLIQRSRNCKLIFEWSGYEYQHGSTEYKNTVEQMWGFLQDEGFTVRRIIPKLNRNGALNVSGVLSFDDFIHSPHGDYAGVRDHVDPWK